MLHTNMLFLNPSLDFKIYSIDPSEYSWNQYHTRLVIEALEKF